MARRLSWLDRIHAILRTVTNSARSHYDRRDLERLFELQPRSAQLLMSALPTVPIGRSHLVEREALGHFLDQLNQAVDPAQEFARIRQSKSMTVRRKLRTLVMQDIDTSLDTLPSAIRLSPGEMRVTFQTVDQLAEAMMHLAVVLTTELEEFASRYEPAKTLSAEEQQARADEEADAKFFESWGRVD